MDDHIHSAIVKSQHVSLKDDGTRATMSVKEGDVVIFESYAPRDIKLNGEEYLIVDQGSIIAVIED